MTHDSARRGGRRRSPELCSFERSTENRRAGRPSSVRATELCQARCTSLISAARSRASWALKAVFEALSPDIASYVRRRGARDPEDVTSEVFVAMIRNIHTFDGDCTGLRSWAYTIAHRRLLDERRFLSRRPRAEPLATAAHLPSTDDVEASVVQSATRRLLDTLCDSLTPDQRTVVRLRFIEHFSIDEVARATDKTPGSVKALQHRGTRALAQSLERLRAQTPNIAKPGNRSTT